MSKKITLEDWLDLCDEFKNENGTILSWTCSFMGWDYDDSEGIKTNREFLKLLNRLLEEKGGE